MRLPPSALPGISPTRGEIGKMRGQQFYINDSDYRN